MKNSIYFLLAFASFCVLGLTSASADAFQSFPIEPQNGKFSVRFSAVPSLANIDGVIGFGGSQITAFSDFNCIVRFGSDGNIDVRNGGTYAADATVPYIKGRKYYIQMDIDVTLSTYSVKVIPFVGDTVTLAQDYAFSADQITGSITHFGTMMVGEDATKFIGVADFQIGSQHIELGHDNFSIKTDPLTGDFFVNVVATPSADKINGAIGLGKEMMTGWSSLNCIVRFNSEGKLDVRNGAEYLATNEVSYVGGKPYLLFIKGNTVNGTYSVKVGTPFGDTVSIAKDYAFRKDTPSDVLNYISQRVIRDETQSGKPNSYIALDGILTGELKYDFINPVISSPITPFVGAFSRTVVITPSADSINASYNLSKIAGQAWGDLNVIVRFTPEGKVDVRNDGAYAADVEFLYEGGISYVVKIDGNTTTSKYTVSIQKSPYSDPVILATDYTFRMNSPSDILNFAGTKTIWDENQQGKTASYLKVSNVGITQDLDESFVNSAPTVATPASFTMFSDESAREVPIVNISDGDGGFQALTASATSSEPTVATVALDYSAGSMGNLTITPVAAGSTTITITVMDDGGTAAQGMDTKTVMFDVTVLAAVALRDIVISTADGEWGADNRILGGKDCEPCYDSWLRSNTGEAELKNENLLINISPKYTYVQYLRFDLSQLPETGGALEASLSLYSPSAKNRGVNSDSINVYVVEDQYFPIKDFQGYIDQELDEFYIEGNEGGYIDIIKEDNSGYIPGYENWIVADNAPGFNEGNESDLSESWDYINHDVLLDVGSKFVFSAKDTLHTFSHPDIAKFINDDSNGVIVFVIMLDPSNNAEFADKSQALYSGENLGAEPFISIKWDSNFEPGTGGCTGDNCEELSTVVESRFGVYPNPTSKALSFTNTDKVYYSNIYTVDGKLVKIDESNNGSALKSIDVSSLHKGLYFLKAYSIDGKLVLSSKFIKE